MKLMRETILNFNNYISDFCYCKIILKKKKLPEIVAMIQT